MGPASWHCETLTRLQEPLSRIKQRDNDVVHYIDLQHRMQPKPL